jgi:phosphoribosylformimino-5-aminoimidazole carboxamide ribotide isomerase
VILFPAIDLKEGRCVRLVQGDMAQATVFNDDPGDQAARFVAQGFGWLHVVDLDGAFAGRPMNGRAVDDILARSTVPVQLGGGIRDMRTVEGWLAKGVQRVIIGTAAVRDPDFVREAARLHPGRIAVGIDAKNGRVAVEGWAATASLTAEELGRRFEDVGVAALIYTDIARDGILTGLNVPMTLALARAVSIPVIASGGLASMADIERLTQPDCRDLAGAITGRALYDGRIDPAEALAVLAASARTAEPPDTRLG